MKKLFRLLFASLLTVSLLVACGGTGDEGKDNGDGEKTLKIVAVLDSGGVDDKSFNESGWDGIQRFLEENNLPKDTATYLSSTEDGSDHVTNLDKAANEGADIVIAIGYLFEPALEEVAPKHPDVDFFFIDGSIEGIPNVTSTKFESQEGSYLVGLVAGLRATEDGSMRVGFIGGMEGPDIGKFQAGFEQGVWESNPDVVIDVQYADSFQDAALGSQIATKMYDAGSNIIFHAAGAVGNGVIGAAKEYGDVFVIGVDKDQYDEGKDEGEASVVLTSMLKRIDVASYTYLQEYYDNDGKISTDMYEFNLANNGTDAEVTEGRNLTSEDIKLVADYVAKYKAGDLTISEESLIPNQKAMTKAEAEAQK